jgi:hypothetical protein
MRMGRMNPGQAQSFLPLTPVSTVGLHFTSEGLRSSPPPRGINSLKMKLTNLRSLLALLALVFVSLAVAIPRKHRVTLTFNYDFNLSPACSLAPTKNCVKQFNVYDATDKERVKLFTIPVPADATGLVQGITGTSPLLSFSAGEHTLVVTAQAADGTESDPGAGTIRVQIKP